MIYIINAIEFLNHSLHKVSKTKAVFHEEASVFELTYLAMNNIRRDGIDRLKLLESSSLILLSWVQNVFPYKLKAPIQKSAHSRF